MTYLRALINPIKAIPTAPASQAGVDVFFTATPTAAIVTPTAPEVSSPPPTEAPQPTLSPTPLPIRIALPPPFPEKQDWNNCGGATLSMYLHFYGWKGDQFTIADKIKPIRSDRNINVDELVNFVMKNVNGLNTVYRVGGTIDMLRQFIAGGIPVMVEESMVLEDDKDYWPNDDHWTGHYLLITGYDDSQQIFITQNTYFGPETEIIQTAKPNLPKSYANLDRDWQGFNRVFILIYKPEQTEIVRAILGNNFDPDTNRQNALDTALAETQANTKNPFAWFNLGSNLVYFEQYEKAVVAYDTARNLGLPQRMLRYQFGPFLAYFHTNRIDDLMALTSHTLSTTPNSEEALLWQGWGYYRLGKKKEAIQSFRDALSAHPGYTDAEYALKYAQDN